MLPLLLSLSAAHAELPTPTVDGDRLISCDSASELRGALSATRGLGGMTAELRTLIESGGVDLAAPIWLVGSQHSARRLHAVSLSLSAGTDPTTIATILPDDGAYTIDGRRLTFTWVLPPNSPTGALALLAPLASGDGCALVRAGDPDSAGAMLIRAGGQEVQARLPMSVFKAGLAKLHLPDPISAPPTGPSRVATEAEMVLAMRWNVQHSTSDISIFIDKIGIGAIELGQRELLSGSEIGLAGTPAKPALAMSLTLPNKRAAKSMVKEVRALAAGRGQAMRADDAAWVVSLGDRKELWVRAEGSRVSLATSRILSNDITDLSTGTPWFSDSPAGRKVPDENPGVFVEVTENAGHIAMQFERDGAGAPLLRLWGEGVVQAINRL